MHAVREANKYHDGPQANLGKPPREEFVVQLEEARTEWRRRHPSDEFSEKAAGV
jgi:hypothetical protein